MGSWTNIAALLSAKTKEGGLSVRPTEGLPFLLTEGMEVTFVPPLLRFPRSSKVKRVEEPTPGKHFVYFEDVPTRSDAEQLEGHFCLIRSEDLPENIDALSGGDVAGFTVCDIHAGVLGTVLRIEENPAHPLLVVKRGDEDTSADLLIPMVDAFIDGIDEDRRVITVSIPEGLLDL